MVGLYAIASMAPAMVTRIADEHRERTANDGRGDDGGNVLPVRTKKRKRIAIVRRTELGARAPVMARIRPLDTPDFGLRKETLRPP
jgi:hypothetical protein